jgi:hypothetical protein
MAMMRYKYVFYLGREEGWWLGTRLVCIFFSPRVGACMHVVSVSTRGEKARGCKGKVLNKREGEIVNRRKLSR